MHGHYREDASQQELWDSRYRERTASWSGKVNACLVTETAGLPPGRALDLGCGEGGDAVWLARAGWRVTAVDVSPVALERAARHGLDQGIADGVDWVHGDLSGWEPPESYELVSAQFLPLLKDEWSAVIHRIAAAVVPGGSLVVVGHHPSDPVSPSGHLRPAEMLFAPEEVTSSLPPDPWHWLVETCAVRERIVTGPAGEELTVTDSVFRATRLRSPD
ncbi:class I SAM-dependent methyltransferase [Amycolatopsis sp. H20-H5]|uniref:class I SAM-dependent methyltransferase n=1 Tax=Amycolatopsis sp. H20-H5 TaxID=3046309 RepID=UPI002DBA43C7|nr:class I SAM-dependent methyltransferase [Amycolatopsis sp. H20-H5]MEC3979694.1 class I SAM-dependent methyltransferase [Amycolatopsis sp. H20-H5]